LERGEVTGAGCGALRGERGWRARSHAVPVLGDRVRHEGVRDQIEQLSLGSKAAGAPEVGLVVDLTDAICSGSVYALIRAEMKLG
jgi:hypothetical protein